MYLNIDVPEGFKADNINNLCVYAFMYVYTYIIYIYIYIYIYI